MYKFIDTTEVSGSALLPSEALQINGEYIENLIPGYRTLNVSGREALSPEIGTFETGVRDGATRQSKRFPARTIIVKYQLIAESNEAFREAYNQLAGVLNVEDAELIFNDEPDKFFTGTPSAIGEVEPGMNAVVGEFEILCVDPFKYSVMEYEVEPAITSDTDEEGNVVTAKTFVVEYNGTYKSYPTFEADFYSESETSEDGETEVALTGDGDCGFIAFLNEEGKIIQLGDPDEIDGEAVPKSQTMINQAFNKSTSYGSAVKRLWQANEAGTTKTSIKQGGSLKMISRKNVSNKTEYLLGVNSYGSGTGWIGTTTTRTVGADAAGDSGAFDFNFTYKQLMAIGSDKNAQKQKGVFEAMLWYADGNPSKLIAGVKVAKTATGKKAKLTMYVNDKSVYSVDIDLSLYNKYFAADYKSKGKTVKPSKTTTIQRTGNKVTFNVAGIKKTFNVADETFVNSPVVLVTFGFAKYSSATALSNFGLYSAKLVKNNCNTFREIPNKFSTDDVAIIDCRKGEIKLNELLTPEYGALGNDWEDFYLKPGTNQIGVAYSDWVLDAFAPTLKMRYREVFL